MSVTARVKGEIASIIDAARGHRPGPGRAVQLKASIPDLKAGGERW
jgi:hypothetical protein